jgi:hypothetical protein
MIHTTDNLPEITYENLLDEIIAKAHFKGAKITSWSQSPNGKTIIYTPDNLPIYYLNMGAAVDSLIHQYKLISEYRHLYKKGVDADKSVTMKISENEPKNSLNSQGLFECDTLVSNMDHELTGSIKRKLHKTIEKISSDYRLTSSDYYHFQNFLVEHYRNKSIEATTTQKKKQYQMFAHFIEEISQSDL